MGLIAGITYGAAGACSLFLLWSLVRLWKRSLLFDSGAFGRKVACAGASIATLFDGVIFYLMTVWVMDLVSPSVSGSPGPLALFLFMQAAIVGVVPNIVGYEVMKRLQ